MFFVRIMMNRKIYVLVIVMLLSLLNWFFLSLNEGISEGEFSEKVKISLREVGNQLLLVNKDSTSLINPIIKIGKLKYELSFQSTLHINPDSLVAVIQKTFERSQLPKHYRVEVIQCEDNEVGYSYEIINTIDNSIVPCKGRMLPYSCYTIEVGFITAHKNSLRNVFLILGLLTICLLTHYLFLRRERENKEEIGQEINEQYFTIGSFQFYPEQNKLVQEIIEINLSKKECELLSIFASRPNEIIKREELTKKVWEDNGVIVGRSLDTYISKLRKKLKPDNTIKLINVHGVGYKLELRT